jgi:hypothetical protein
MKDAEISVPECPRGSASHYIKALVLKAYMEVGSFLIFTFRLTVSAS